MDAAEDGVADTARLERAFEAAGRRHRWVWVFGLGWLLVVAGATVVLGLSLRRFDTAQGSVVQLRQEATALAGEAKTSRDEIARLKDGLLDQSQKQTAKLDKAQQDLARLEEGLKKNDVGGELRQVQAALANADFRLDATQKTLNQKADLKQVEAEVKRQVAEAIKQLPRPKEPPPGSTPAADPKVDWSQVEPALRKLVEVRKQVEVEFKRLKDELPKPPKPGKEPQPPPALWVSWFDVVLHSQAPKGPPPKDRPLHFVFAPEQRPGGVLYPDKFGRVAAAWWAPVGGSYDSRLWPAIRVSGEGNQVRIDASSRRGAEPVEARVYVLYYEDR
jgi:hypothetical protein